MVSSLPRATSASDDRALNTLLEGEATQQGKSLALMKLEDLDKLLDQLVTNITTISDTISERAVMLGKEGHIFLSATSTPPPSPQCGRHLDIFYD